MVNVKTILKAKAPPLRPVLSAVEVRGEVDSSAIGGRKTEGLKAQALVNR